MSVRALPPRGLRAARAQVAGRLVGARRGRARRPGRLRRAALAAVPPRLRRRLLALLALCLLLAAGYGLWLRDSSLVAVEDVSITGLTTKDAPRVRAALASAAHTMTTLHVEQAELERAIAAYPVVRALEVRADFPHRLEIHVLEHQPAALVDGLPVAGDGTILRGIPVEGELPTIDTRGTLSGNRLTEAAALHAARVAGRAPGPLRARLEHVGMRAGDGIVVSVREGPELIFGGAANVHAKWIAATRILADPEAAGASYIDVRLPGRPAAGGLPAETLAPVAPAGSDEAAPPPAAPAAPAPAVPAAPDAAPEEQPTVPAG